MPRLASLFLPDLAIERLRRRERIARWRDAASPSPTWGEGGAQSASFGRVRASGEPIPSPSHPAAQGGPLPLPGTGEGGWRPGARWARAIPSHFTVHSGAATVLVTAHRLGNRNLIAAACAQASALGLEPGMPLTKARVLVPALDVRDADPDGDALWLARLGLFAARRWTPGAALSGPDGLWLDLTGTAHLFGGEERMCARILAFLGRLGFSARIAVAGTAGAAHALARFGGAPLILCPSGREADALAGFPLAALRLDDDALGRARRLGLERVGELVAMPRAPLQRRFGAGLLTRLDQALGCASEPFDPIVPAEPPSVTLRFLEPIATAEAIAEAAAEALRRLVPMLEESGLGIRRLALLCARVDNEEQGSAVSLARATRDGAHLHRLLCAKIETIEPGFGIERIRLVASRVEPLGPRPIAGALSGEAPAPDLALLIDRLAVRLGARRLYRLGARESDVPERSLARAGPLGAPAGWPDWPRPIRLLHPPEPVERVMALLPDGAPMRFSWRGRAYRVAAADGPERIHGEWWHRAGEAEAVRDYFQVEDERGARFWLYRKGDLSWHMHGLFA